MRTIRKKVLGILLFLAVVGANGSFLAEPANAANQYFYPCPMGQGGADCYDSICSGPHGSYECCLFMLTHQCGDIQQD